MGSAARLDLPPAITGTDMPWRTVLLCCRKCSRKLDGGFGPKGRDSLPELLKRVLRDRGQRRSVRVVEIPCLGLCPKGAVTVLRAEAPGCALSVPRGLGAEQLADRLLPRPDPSRLTPDDPAAS